MNKNDINQIANKYVSKSTGVNTIKLLNNIQRGKKISVVGKYVDLTREDYINYLDFLDKNNNIFDDYYYGLSPKLTNTYIASKIKGDTFKDTNNLKGFLKDNGEYFNLHKNDRSYEFIEALFARTIIRIVTSYGFILNADNRVKQELKEVIKDEFDANYLIDSNFKEGKVFFRGRLNDKLIGLLKAFSIKYEKNNIILLNDNSGENIESLYKESSPYKISIYRNGYYSGVIPSLLHIEEKEETYNSKVVSINLYLEKTTFALEDSIDKTDINNLSILYEFKKKLEEFEKSEDELEEKYIYSASDDLDNINSYLNESLNTRIIGVSSNIVTKDGYLLFGHRNFSVVDKSTLYSSFNGQSEIYDKNVEFYNTSVYEDLPTIKLDNKERIDFKNEFAREMLAELSLSGFDKDYKYYGVSCLGMNQDLWKINNPNKINKERRLHFNILAVHKSDKTFEEIEKTWKDSTEAFENLAIYGVKFNFFKSKKQVIGYLLLSFLRGLNKYRNLLSSTILLLIAFVTLSFINTTYTLDNLTSTILNWIFVAISIIIFIYDLFIYLVKFKWKKELSFSLSIIGKRKGNNYINKIVKEEDKKLLKRMKQSELKAFKNNKERKEDIKEKYKNKKEAFAPIAFLLNLLYINDFRG